MTTGAATATRRPAAARRRPSLRVWLHTRLHWWALDARLAEGEATTTRELRLRAAQLTSPRFREQLADSLESTIDAARRPHPRLTARVPINARGVLESEGVVRGVCNLLRDDGQSARAVAIVSLMLRDGNGPLFDPNSEHLLGHELRFARDLLREVAR